MTTLFHDMMHKEIEVYVYDMIAKSRTEEEHVKHLLKLFERLRKYKLHLNPNKCIFSVRSGKLLGLLSARRVLRLIPPRSKQYKRCMRLNLRRKFGVFSAA